MPTAEQRFVSFPNKYGPYRVADMKRIRESADMRHNGCAVFDKSKFDEGV